jgi:uncharacterized protein (UPF0261 family)
MAQFRYIGSDLPRADGTYAFRVRSKGFEVVFRPGEVFTVPDDQSFVLKCIEGHIEWSTKQKDYQKVV